MGVPAKLSRVRRPAGSRRRGAALPTAIFGLVVLSVLGAGIYSVGSVQRQATTNRETTARALLVTEEGVAHAVAVVRDSLRNQTYTRLLKGSDNADNTSDDGRVLGYTLGSSLGIPVAGRTTTDGSFTAHIRDDDGDPATGALVDGNFKVIMRCTGTTTTGASASIDVVIGSTPMPAMAVDGPLDLAADASIVGSCGGVHTNGDLTLDGDITTTGTVTSSGAITGSGSATTPSGTAVTPQASRPTVDIPELSSAEFCPNSTYELRANGTILHRPSGMTYTAIASAVFGWRRTSASPVLWEGSSAIPPASYCIIGNVQMSGSVGTAATPVVLSMFVTGSVKISGNPFLAPSYDDITVVADGDVWIAGTADASNENYEGTVFAGAQCRLSGTPRVAGQLMCKNRVQPSGAIEHAAVSTLIGHPEITYGCGSTLARRKILEWIQVSN